MAIIEKIEDLIFQSKVMSHVEIIKNKMVIIKMRCTLIHLSDDCCQLRVSDGTCYKIMGNQLQVKEYGDTYAKIVGSVITGVLIEGGTTDE